MNREKVPKEGSLEITADFKYTAPAYSVTVIRIRAAE